MEGRELCISSMTWGELQSGVARLPESKRRSELLRWLQQLEINFDGRMAACGPEGYNPPNFINIAKAYEIKTIEVSKNSEIQKKINV